MPLLNDADAIYHGATPVDAVYLGDEKVWPPTPAYAYPVWRVDNQASGTYLNGEMKSSAAGGHTWVVLAAVGLYGKDAVAWVAANSGSATTLHLTRADGTDWLNAPIREVSNPATSGNIGIDTDGSNMRNLPDGELVAIRFT